MPARADRVTRRVGTVLAGLLLAQAQAGAAELAGTLWDQVARQHGLPAALLVAVALQESGRARPGRVVSPWPWALNTPAGARYFDSALEAESALRETLAEHGPGGLDVGLLQVNLRWHGHRVADPVALLDPRTNLAVAAEVLAQAVHSAPGDPALGVGRYHHWRDEGLARAYGRRVLALARALGEDGAPPVRARP